MNHSASTVAARPNLPSSFRKDADGSVTVVLDERFRSADPATRLIEFNSLLQTAPATRRIGFASASGSQVDSLSVAMVLDIIRASRKQDIEVDETSLPDTIRKLVSISLSIAPRGEKVEIKQNFIARLGTQTVSVVSDARRFVEFLGELLWTCGRFTCGKARFRKADFWMIVQSCSVGALPIVGLISFLIGVILAFVGGAQLARFGATIFMVDLVAIAVAREMGCIMTGVIMSGRTGAAFAAQMGSMNVNEEVDALSTLGISPMEYLVLPRALAMVLMMPLLTIYADIIGWFGGFVVALPLQIGPSEFWAQLVGSLELRHVAIGIVKSCFFGVIVAGAGCYYGLLSGRSSASVGEAATKAVVAGITWIIVLDAVFAFALQILGL